MPPHTPCTWAMTCFSTWTGPSNKRASSAGPRLGKCNRPGKDGLTVISSSLAPDWLLTGRLPKLQGCKEKKKSNPGPVAGHQSDLAILHCLTLGCAGQLVLFSLPYVPCPLGHWVPKCTEGFWDGGSNMPPRLLIALRPSHGHFCMPCSLTKDDMPR
jgi:hypothetical protein